MKYDIFISYSRKDFEEVSAIKERIESEIPEISVWFDLDGVESGDEFEDKIISAIDESNIVLFALSENSINSKWTKDEVMYARNVGKKIVPILLKGAHMRGWFLFKFGRVDCIDSENPLQMQKLIDNLCLWCVNWEDNAERPTLTPKSETRQTGVSAFKISHSDNPSADNSKKQTKLVNKLMSVYKKRYIIIIKLLIVLAAGIIYFLVNRNTNQQPLLPTKANDTIYVSNDSIFDENNAFVGCYTGQKFEGKMYGRGIFRAMDGSVRIGDFVDDEFIEGSMETTDHYRFEGEARDNQPYNGKWYNPDGSFCSEVINGEEQ